MKLTATLMLCACCLALSAAVSPYRTADDYVFTRPALSNAVHGLVIGDSGDYATMRLEDIYFLREAVAERSCLLGATSFASSNAFVSHVQNVATNPPSGQFAFKIEHDDFELPVFLALSPTSRLNTAAVVIRDTAGNLHGTNSWESSSWRWSTNEYVHATNEIVQTMTDGSRDVWKNAWPYAYTSNLVESVAVTNSGSIYDLCFVPHGLHTLAEDGRYFRYMSSTSNPAFNFSGPYAMSTITNLYALLKDMNRSVPHSCDFRLWTTNGCNATWTVYDTTTPPGTPYTYTYPVSNLAYSVNNSKARDYEYYQYRDGSEWKDEEGQPKDRETVHRDTKIPDGTITLQASIDRLDVATTYRADSPRIETADAFVVVKVESESEWSTSRTTADGIAHDGTNTYAWGECLVPVGRVDRMESRQERLAFRIDIELEVYRTAAELLGVEFLSATHEPSLPGVPSPEWQERWDGQSRHRTSSQYRRESIACSITDVILILNLKPSTSLSTWSEYE